MIARILIMTLSIGLSACATQQSASVGSYLSVAEVIERDTGEGAPVLVGGYVERRNTSFREGSHYYLLVDAEPYVTEDGRSILRCAWDYDKRQIHIAEGELDLQMEPDEIRWVILRGWFARNYREEYHHPLTISYDRGLEDIELVQDGGQPGCENYIRF